MSLVNSFSWAITRQKRRPSHLTTRILNIYTEALIGFCLEYHAEWSLQCTALSRSLKKAPAMGTVGRMYIPRIGEGEHFPTVQAFSSSTTVHILLMNSPSTLPLGTASANSTWPPLLQSTGEFSKGFHGGGVVHLVAIWLPWNRCHSNSRGKCKKKQIKKWLPK